ncbi:MAG: hypothetical protein AB7L84_14665 [Acidimicrobiia bacterium]
MPWWVRLRALAGLAVVVVLLGVLLAAGVGLALAVVQSILDGALR